MTNITKRRRGRPLGEGIDDSTTLQTIVDMIVATPSLGGIEHRVIGPVACAIGVPGLEQLAGAGQSLS